MAEQILVVDDELPMLRVLERIISADGGYEVTTTNNALEVPALLEKTCFDLVIADLRMPGMSGMEMLRLIRSSGRPEEVIIITAFPSNESEAEAIAGGAFDYITKPFTKEQIVAAVARAMRWQHRKQQERTQRRILEIEPFDQARREFEREYVQRLAQRYSGDKETMARRSGLSADALHKIQTEEETGKS
jgi:DNA-binding NtrC family response regulator